MKNKKLCVMKHCLSEDLGEELIILDIESGLYHSLNKTASIIWSEIKEKSPSLEELIKILKKDFNSARVFSDCNYFVKELLEKKLIEYK